MLRNLFQKKAKLSPEEELAEWERKGRPVPPVHVVKQKAIDAYRIQYGLSTLVETGTYLGDMVEAQRNRFTQIFSIELSERLYRKALKRFKAYSHIHLLQGDSGEKLKEIVAALKEPALFWLDGHYSGGITAKGAKECPVREELAAMLNSKWQHIILIDDARLFIGSNDYPDMNELLSIVKQADKKYAITTIDDIIRITPG
jgi:hypothetical protein